MTSRPHDLPRAIALFVTAFFLFTLLDSISKHLGRSYPAVQLTFMRFFVHFLAMLVVLGPGMRLGLVRTGRPALQVVRGLLLVTMSWCMIQALRFMSLADATTVVFVSPLVVIACSPWLLGERVSVAKWIAVAAGFGGVLLILRPGSGFLGDGVWYALAVVVVYSAFQILTRRLAATEQAVPTHFITALVGTCVAGLAVPTAWLAPASATDLGLMACMGLFGGLGHFLFIKAYERAPASTLSPFMYSALIWAIVLGYGLFGEVPGASSLAGMLVIVAAGIATLRIGLAEERARVARPAQVQ